MLSRTEALDIIHAVGKEKGEDLIRRFTYYLERIPNTMSQKQSSVMDEINHEVKFMARAVMRDPDPKVLEMLYAIHGKLKKIFLNQSNADLEFILSHEKFGRGGFQDAQQLKLFLEANPSDIQLSRLLTGIENFLTCISYCRITMKSITEDEPQYKIKVLVMDLLPDVIPHISTAYVDRNEDTSEFDSSTVVENILFPDISEASGEDVPKLSSEKLDGRSFRIETEQGKLTFPGASLESNIPVIGHVSGTQPTVFSLIERLLSDGGDKVDAVLQTDEDYKKLTGALFAATYLRAAFHTPAEVYAGYKFYMAVKKNQKVEDIEQLQPREAFIGGLELLSSAANGDGKYGLNKNISLKTAIETVSLDLSNKVGNKQVGEKSSRPKLK